jgi:F-type H+-transporting ATPase subunit delta
MLGASRESLAALVEAVEARRDDLAGVAADVYAVADLLGRDKPLRSALADSGQPAAARSDLADTLLASRIGATAMDIVRSAVSRRWSTPDDLVLGLEAVAAQAAFTVAQADGTLDAAEEEIFRFGRAVDASADLQMALTDPALGTSVKSGIVRDLLAGRAAPVTLQVLEYAVGHLHGRRIDTVVDELTAAAAQQRQRVVAEVRVARPLDAEQARRMADVLSRLAGRDVRLNVAIDPAVLGGAHVTIGDQVIDGTIASRLEQARRAMLG